MAALLSAPYPEGQKERVKELLAGGCGGHSAERIALCALLSGQWSVVSG